MSKARGPRDNKLRARPQQCMSLETGEYHEQYTVTMAVYNYKLQARGLDSISKAMAIDLPRARRQSVSHIERLAGQSHNRPQRPENRTP
jgi:hypothetical protein